MFDEMTMDRRSAMAQVLMLLGAATVPIDVAMAAPAARRRRFLAPAQFALLSALADTIVPATDTPGAIAAGVPAKLDGMLSTWASPATRTAITGALSKVDAAARAKTGKPFAALTAKQRADVLGPYDAAALKPASKPAGAPTLSFFTQIAYVADNGYLSLKGLLINLYYASEVACTNELPYEHNPGKFVPSFKTTEATRPWASFGPI
jgi:hypothetical protein